jgi:hypothetical protein
MRKIVFIVPDLSVFVKTCDTSENERNPPERNRQLLAATAPLSGRSRSVILGAIPENDPIVIFAMGIPI